MATQFVFDEIEKGIKADPSLVSKVNGIFHFKIDGKSWTVDLKNGSGSVKSGAPASSDCTVTCDGENFLNLMTGKSNGQNLFMQGKLKLQGNMALAMKLDKLPKTPAPPTDSAPSTPTTSSTPTTGGSGFKALAVFEDLTKKNFC